MDYWPNLPALQSATSRDNRSQIFVKSRDFQDQHTTQRDHQSCIAEKPCLQSDLFLCVGSGYKARVKVLPKQINISNQYLSLKSMGTYALSYARVR